jgi:hypothetical protein
MNNPYTQRWTGVAERAVAAAAEAFDNRNTALTGRRWIAGQLSVLLGITDVAADDIAWDGGWYSSSQTGVTVADGLAFRVSADGETGTADIKVKSGEHARGSLFGTAASSPDWVSIVTGSGKPLAILGELIASGFVRPATGSAAAELERELNDELTRNGRRDAGRPLLRCADPELEALLDEEELLQASGLDPVRFR